MKIIIIAFILLVSTLGFAQKGINYKALIKDDAGNVVANNDVIIQFTILKTSATGTIAYQENQTVTTDVNGLLITNIGAGMPTISAFNTIDWANDFHFLKVEISLGAGLVDMGTTEFMAVPYALSSGDKSWDVASENVHVTSKNVGIGTNNPTALLQISDTNTAGVSLTVPSIGNESQIEFKNGSETGLHTFYKIENRSDLLRFEIDTDLTATAGYEDLLSLSRNGLALDEGVRVNEFSNDPSLGDESATALVTEKAVKAHVYNRTNSNYWVRRNLATSSISSLGNTLQPIGPAVIINKQFVDSNIEVTVNTLMSKTSTSGTVFGVSFEIHIDNQISQIFNDGQLKNSTQSDFVSMFSVFQGLSVGTHTVQIYARSTGNSTSTNVRLDSGNNDGAIIIKETF